MIITLKKNAPKDEVNKLIHNFEQKGLSVTMIHGDNYNVFGLVGDTSRVDEKLVKAHPFVENVTRIAAPYKKANRLFHPADTIVDVAGIKVGGKEKIVAYKPRTSPYAFQGMGTKGIQCMMHARETYGLPIVSELMSVDKLDEFVENVDLIQIGARNMQNFDLLKAVGRVKKPVLLKRGLANTIEEWIMAAEYIMSEGNENVIFCERGIRTFETYTRNTLDLSVIPILKEKTHLPIIIDPSHATGDWKLVESASLAAIAAGADGLIIEVHNDPENAWSDGAQSLKPERFKEVIDKGKAIATVIGRDM